MTTEEEIDRVKEKVNELVDIVHNDNDHEESESIEAGDQ
jgi:hypothetical protein